MGKGNHSGNSKRARNMVRPLAGLRRVRLERGLSQQQMGDWLGVTKSHYGKFELGLTPMTYHEAKKVAKGLGITMEELDGPEDSS